MHNKHKQKNTQLNTPHTHAHFTLWCRSVKYAAWGPEPGQKTTKITHLKTAWRGCVATVMLYFIGTNLLRSDLARPIPSAKVWRPYLPDCRPAQTFLSAPSKTLIPMLIIALITSTLIKIPFVYKLPCFSVHVSLRVTVWLSFKFTPKKKLNCVW